MEWSDKHGFVLNELESITSTIKETEIVLGMLSSSFNTNPCLSLHFMINPFQNKKSPLSQLREKTGFALTTKKVFALP